MRIIAKKTLKDFWATHPDSEQPLRAWHAKTKFAKWESLKEIKKDYRNVSFIANNRIFFNMK